MKPSKSKYCIKSCPTDNSEQLELLLNTMSEEGWDLYSMHEAESDNEEDGYQFNCIFVKEIFNEDFINRDLSEYFGFKTKMERIMSQKKEPIDLCLDIQKKIKEQRAKIQRIKSLLDSTSEDSRKHLNEEISVNIEELEKLKQKLFEYVSPDLMYKKIGEEKLTITLSEELTELLDPDTEVNLITRIVQTRQNLTEQSGYVIPEVRTKYSDELQANEFTINVRGIQSVKSSCYPKHLMFFKDELNLEKLPKNTIKDADVITGKKIVWIEEDKAKDFWVQGLDANEYIARLLEYVSVKNIDDILDYSDINKYIEIVASENLFLVENILPEFISIGELKYLITNLIKEKVSVKDIVYIFEKINDYSSSPAKEDLLTGIRKSLSRQITSSLVKDGIVNTIELSEKSLTDLTGKKDKDNIVKIESTKVSKLVKNINKTLEEKNINIKDVVIVLPSEIRQIGYLVLSKFIPDITVVAKEELSVDYPTKNIGLV